MEIKKIQQLRDLAAEHNVSIDLIFDLVLSLEDPNIQSKHAFEIFAQDMSKTYSEKGLDLTDKGEDIVSKYLNIVNNIPIMWEADFEAWYDLFPLKVGDRLVRTGKNAARKLYKSIIEKVPSKQLYDTLKNHIDNMSAREKQWMPGPVKWLGDEEYLKAREETFNTFYGKEIA